MVTIYSDLTTQSKKNFEDRFINNDFMTERRRLGKKVLVREKREKLRNKKIFEL